MTPAQRKAHRRATALVGHWQHNPKVLRQKIAALYLQIELLGKRAEDWERAYFERPA